ncbi:MAG: T9SS type A sorting domain-containing protein [Parafilimonas sp.]
MYPNPANNNAVVQFTSNKTLNYTVEITDVSGKVLQTKNGTAVVGKNNVMIDVSKYAQGMYMITLTDDEHGKRTLKLNKE